MIVPPGSTIGIVGGGQLGRMLSVAAAKLGYKCHIYDPHEHPVAADVAAHFTRGAFDDTDALRDFGEAVDVATYEFENLPPLPLASLGDKLRPGAKSLAIAQDRAVEKRFIEETGARVAPWREVDSLADATAAVADLGMPLVLKSRRLGYDGKGQAWVTAPADLPEAMDSLRGQPAVAEARVAFEAEFSIIVARSAAGECIRFDAPRNEHGGGILRRSSLPAGEPVESQVAAAEEMAFRIAEALVHIGVLTVEFFATADGPIVNEIAPRVHNSGHWTIEGAATSQFEQHIRAICGLPLGSPRRVVHSVTMDNLIGDEMADWPVLLEQPGASVHIYGKGEARPGRKMGHVTYLSD